MADLPKCGTCKWAAKPEDIQMRIDGMRLCHGATPIAIPIGRNKDGAMVTETHGPLVLATMDGCRHHEVDIVS